ncbi:hypothetical protein OOU_Y34scaffold00308g41 [Pyricularia oryzae Y34]|uniref:Uncharacterized protein n=1 Tax=Pyricularia oryzae (strain Y34) TaxID=1143189 RepID=A0AA97P2W4_PYRO3|nr:hypothetical protein OOU_Y34scaffold00308g41 [Pyricularia oryzae Y34]
MTNIGSVMQTAAHNLLCQGRTSLALSLIVSNIQTPNIKKYQNHLSLPADPALSKKMEEEKVKKEGKGEE